MPHRRRPGGVLSRAWGHKQGRVGKHKARRNLRVLRCEMVLTANVGVREVRNGLHDQNPLVWSFEGTVKVQTGMKCWCASYVYPHLNEGQQLLVA